jgi:hypothetical protein
LDAGDAVETFYTDYLTTMTKFYTALANGDTAGLKAASNTLQNDLAPRSKTVGAEWKTASAAARADNPSPTLIKALDSGDKIVVDVGNTAKADSAFLTAYQNSDSAGMTAAEGQSKTATDAAAIDLANWDTYSAQARAGG